MAEPAADISRRAVVRGPEVCEIAGLQPFVLRSWEAEFPDLGVARSPGGPRLYSRTDVERVLQLKQLVFGEGLTLAGARRRIEEERGRTGASPNEMAVPVEELLGAEARERLVRVREGLRAILDLLAAQGERAEPTDFSLTVSPAPNGSRRKQERRGKLGAAKRRPRERADGKR